MKFQRCVTTVPDSPDEPDPEPYEPMPPRLIPLDVDSSMMGDGYVEPMDPRRQQGSAMAQNEGSELPPVLANLMGNLSNSSRSPQASSTVSNPAAPAVNVRGLLSSIMGATGNQLPQDLINQPDFSPHFSPNNRPGGPHFNHPPPSHYHGPPLNASGGPRMMGPPPGQGRGENSNYWGEDSMRGGPHRGGHFHRGGGGGPRGGHNNMNDMSRRPVCHHFMRRGSCRYEGNCAFYHPGVNGPPLPPNHPANNQHNQNPQQ